MITFWSLVPHREKMTRHWDMLWALTSKRVGTTYDRWYSLALSSSEEILAGPQQTGRIARLQDRPQSQAPFLFFAGANGNFINGFLQVTTQQKRPYKTGRTISVDIRVPESTQANIEVLSGVTVMGYFSRYLERPKSSCTQGRPQAGCCILVTCLLRALTDTHASKRKRRLLWGAYSLTP